MTLRHGFELVSENALTEAGSTARIYRHARTGAELLSLLNSDENKVFGVAFRTPPRDSTGIAHILEHSVLCGSRKFPVKEPFVELMKSSLNTFLNAMTYGDKTVYPVASQNRQDFYNLVDVYLDAVFYPRITEDTFRQEGWHYELDAINAPLAYKGVVFNEMKGAYSSPDAVLDDLSQRSLYPDIAYGVDSGGDPKHIPDLTYADFKDFHRRLYHPSNARLFFYGDDDPDERLRRLDACLAGFDASRSDTAVGIQPRFAAARQIERSYAAAAEETGVRTGLVTVNWMFDEPEDAEADLALTILDEILGGTPAAPLRKALIESGLGAGLTGSGLEGDLRQPAFSIGLKGIDPADSGRVEALILETLRGLADDGIDRGTVDAALNTVTFSLRENNTGRFPRGIALMLRSLRFWLHDRDPLATLRFEAPLAAIQARVASGERYFENLLRRTLVENPHRTTVLLRPDAEQADREAAEERARLDNARAAMTAADLEALVAATHELKRQQETPDSPEALSAIPTLTLGDLPRQNKTVPLERDDLGQVPVFYHDIDTSGVLYLDIGMDLHALPADLLPYVGVFGRALLETGTANEDFVALSQRIGRFTGGIQPSRWTSSVRGADRATGWLFLRSKVMPERAGDLLAILSEVLRGARLDDRERFRQIVAEEKARLESRVAPMGLRLVDLRLRGGFNEADWASETMGGLSYLFFLRRLADEIETDWTAVSGMLNRIRALLINRAAMIFNVTAGPRLWQGFRSSLEGFAAALPRSASAVIDWPRAPLPRFEGLTLPARINFVGKGADLRRMGYTATGATEVAVNYLRTTWLWDKVRVQGGAYGGTCRFDRLSGGFTFLSYRDPNLLATLDIYDGSADFLRNADLNASALTRSIIGTIGDIDIYQLPDDKGFASLQRHLAGDSDEIRQRVREEILSTTAADFRGFADALAAVAREGAVLVLGSDKAIAAANAERQGFLEVARAL